MPASNDSPRRSRSPRSRSARAVRRDGGSGHPAYDGADLGPDLDPEVDPEADGAAESEAAVARRARSEAERRAMFEALLAEDPFVDEEPEPPAGPEPHVTAILVAHDGAGWLPEALAAIAEQSRQPDHLVAVDTGSTDDTSALLTRAFGSGAVVTLPRDSGYGTAVNAGLAAAPVPTDDPRRRQWVWLLHDDCAPDPTALERLLDHARRNPSVGIVGPKAVDWAHPDRLVGIGLTTDRAGRRITDLEHFELDQGQHDQPRDVLALGTAGSLIRRDVWDALGGFDPRLPLLREDIDLGWRANLAGYRVVLVPAARVRHVR
ncbi:MAG TPA: glycosyltransferase family 2 protein, partial [Trebonia sp.]|nr:glycosyltransferase family 2 protein [Trebonia sp.]